MLLPMLVFPILAGGQTVIAQWDFEDSDSVVDTYTPENTGMYISRENTPGIVTTFPSGNPGYAISTDNWDNGDGIKYWMVEVNTSNTRNLIVKWDQYSESGGPTDFRFQYRIGIAGIWTPSIGNDITVPNSVWTSYLLPLPAACDNQSSVFLRWIMRSNVSAGCGLVTATSLSMMDNISISGIHDYSCFTNGYLTYYTCGADYNFPTAASGGLTSAPPGLPGSPDYGSCWKNINSGNRATWILIRPTVSGLWTFTFTPTTGNINTWIWGGYTTLPTDCADLLNPLDCNNGTGGNPISITANVIAGLYYMTLVTNPTGTNSSVHISNIGVADIVPPVVFGAQNCGPASLTLSVTGANPYERYKWFDSPVGGTLLKRSIDNLDSTFVTPFLIAPQTYWVSKLLVIPGPPIDSCESERAPVDAAILFFPVAPLSIVADRPAICFNDTGPLTLTAIGGLGTTLRWFIDSCGGTEIGTGNPLILPVPAVTSTYYARWENFCGISGCTSVTVIMQSPVTPGSIAADQTICQGGDPAAITNTITGSGSGVITYRWERFTGAGPWTVIIGENSDSYNPPAGLMATTLYRRVTLSTLAGVFCESLPTAAVTVIVNVITPGIVGSDQLICFGSIPAVLTELSGATGSGTQTYQWQNSTAGCAGPWTDIPGAVNSTYAPPSLVQPTFFHRVVTFNFNGVDCSATSGCVTINIISIDASVTGTNVTCFGANDGAAFVNVSGGGGGYTFLWNDPQAQTTNPATNLSPGTYTVIITDAIMCSVSRSVTIIQQYLTPSAILSLISGENVCKGDSVIMRVDLTGTPPWSLTYSDGSVSTTVSGIISSPYTIQVYPANTCIYTITALTDAFCTAVPGMLQGSGAVTLYPPPLVEYTWNTTMINYEIQFHIDSSITNLGAIGYMVLWNFGDGTFGYGHNPPHLYPGSSTFNCTLTVTDTNGCVNSITHLVIVPEIPHAFFSVSTPGCQGQPVCFTDLSFVSSSPFGYITTWIWNFDDGSPNDTIHFPNDPNICHIYTTLDTYSVTLTVIDNVGYNDDYTGNVFMLPNPIAGFTYSTNCEDQPVQFTDTSGQNGGGAIISWSWDFGDPISGIYNTSILQNPNHTFTTGNSLYNVRLIIQNFNGCIDTIINPVYILAKPALEFTHDSACNGQVVNFTADPLITHLDSIVSWSWDFGDGSVPVNNPVTATHTYTSPATYITTLTVVDHHGCINSVSHGVKVNPLPIAVFSWSSLTCSGNPVLFTDNSGLPLGYAGYVAKWLWDFGDGTTQLVILPGSPNVIHTFVGPGLSHTVRLTVWTNDSCSQFVEHVVVSIPGPVADYTTSAVHCSNQVLQFTDLTNPNGGGSISQWTWNFDDPGSGINNTSTLQNPQHTYNNAGSYQVSLIVTNLTGCNDTIRKTVDINVAPVADFHADTVCLYNPTQFTDFSTPNATNIITYSWDFGDGSAISNQQNPAHTYATSGIFNVKHTIVNSNGCTQDTTKPVLVNPLPNAAFSFNSQNCLGAAVQFTDLSTTPLGYPGSIIMWLWDFGDGTSTTILTPANPNVVHTFAGTALSHVVRLTVTTSDGCTGFTEHTVSSIPSPVADFGFPATNCTTPSVQFTDLSQTNGGGSILSWHWNFGDPVSGTNNISIIRNPVHFYTSPGIYNVTLIIINVSSCSDTIQKTITISPSPLANFTADTVCLNQATQFIDISIPNASGIIGWVWDFGDGSAISDIQNPTHIYLSYGIKNVNLTITNSNGCVRDTNKQVMVRPLPLAEFTFSAKNCHGSPVQYTDGSSIVPGYLVSIVEWVWDFGDGTSTTIFAPGNPNVTHTFAGMANSYTVRLTVTTSDGCTNYIEKLVNSMPSPTANFTYPSGNCVQQPVPFTDNSQTNGGGNITKWLWDFGDPVSGVNNTSVLQNPVHIFFSSGIHTVTEIVYNESNCSDTSIHTITVIPLPLANFVADTSCVGSTTTFTDQSSTSSGIINQHLWDFGDGTTSTEINPVHAFLTDGVHQVKLTVTTQDGCIKDTTKAVFVASSPVATFNATGPTCLGALVQFTDNSYAMYGSIHEWRWDFGDGATVTILNPVLPDISHMYQFSGTYTVVLNITTYNGCTATTSMPVTVEPAPIADYIYASNRCEMSPVQFNDMTQLNGGSSITQWLWSFNDPGSGINNSSTIPNPIHSFTTSGNYNVTLHVTTVNGCVDSTTKSVSVSAKPVAQFSSDTACSGSATQFTDQSVANAPGIASWNWNFGDPVSGTNNTSVIQNPEHIYANAGNYLVSLTVINSNQCEKDTVMLVSVPVAPVAMFGSSSACVNTATQFTDLSISPDSDLSSWFWDFGDGVGTSTVQNPFYTYTSSGTYNVKLRVTNLIGCSDSVTIPVVSRPTPQANYDYTNFFCPAGQVIFHDQSQGAGTTIAERLWTFEPGSTSNLHDPVHVFPVTDTNYIVTLVVTDEFGCLDTVSKSVYVKTGFSLAFLQDTACFNNPTHFHAMNNAPGDSLYDLQWNFGDDASGSNNTSSLFNPTHIFTSQGAFIVKLRATDKDNCMDSIYQVVSVNALPQPSFTATSLPCDPLTFFKDFSVPGSGPILSWTWDFGDGSPFTTIVAPGCGDTYHVYVNRGNYNVVLKVTNINGCSDTTSMMINIPACINANFNQSSPGGCTNKMISLFDQSLPLNIINQWYWDFGDGSDTLYNSFSGSVMHRYSSPGIYNIVLKIFAMVNGQAYTDSTIRQVTIQPSPLVSFSAAPACLNQLNIFHDQSNTFGSDISSWRWNFDDPSSGINNFSNSSDPSHLYYTAGEYNVSLEVTSNSGCTDSAIKQTRVFALPGARFISTLACMDNPTYFFDQSIVDTTIDRWQWNFGVPQTKKDTSTLRYPVYEYNKEGNYDVLLIIRDSHGCYDTVDSTIRVNPSPLSAFVVLDNVSNKPGKIQLKNKSEKADSYYWDFGNGYTSTEEDPVVTYSQDGTFTIMLVSANKFGCTDTSFNNYEVLFKGLFVPNAFVPASDILGVNIFKPIGINLMRYKIEVFDSWGHLIWSSSLLDVDGRPVEGWDGRKSNGDIYQSGTYVWKINATFEDGTTWEGSDIGKGEHKSIGTVTLIR